MNLGNKERPTVHLVYIVRCQCTQSAKKPSGNAKFYQNSKKIYHLPDVHLRPWSLAAATVQLAPWHAFSLKDA